MQYLSFRVWPVSPALSRFSLPVYSEARAREEGCILTDQGLGFWSSHSDVGSLGRGYPHRAARQNPEGGTHGPVWWGEALHQGCLTSRQHRRGC